MGKKKTAGTQVTLGWVVKVQFRKAADETSRGHSKVVSHTFSSEEAANTFKALAEKDAAENPNPQMLDPIFFVTRDMGVDNIKQAEIA